jgi:hypothetical protein
MKMLGLAAVSVAAVMAFLGAGSASAAPTVLCKVAELPCAAGNRYPANTSITGESEGSAKLEGINSAGKTELTVECASKTTLKNTAESGEPLPGSVTGLSFTGCNNSCSVSVTGLPYSGTLSWTSGSNGLLIVKKVSATLTCLFGFVKCKVGAKEVDLTVDGGNPAKVLANKVAMELEAQEAGTCPAKALWTATYKATSPTAVFVSHT